MLALTHLKSNPFASTQAHASQRCNDRIHPLGIEKAIQLLVNGEIVHYRYYLASSEGLEKKARK